MKQSKLIKKQENKAKHGCVIMYGCNKQNEPNPTIGNVYYVYDDGKVRPSREYSVKIIGYVGTNELNKHIRKIWENAVIECYWLFSPYEGTVYYGDLLDEYGERKIEWFCRTKDGGWFGFYTEPYYCWDNGRLDVTGRLHKLAYGEVDV